MGLAALLRKGWHDPRFQLERLDQVNKRIDTRVDQMAEASADYATTPHHPHPGLDKTGAADERCAEEGPKVSTLDAMEEMSPYLGTAGLAGRGAAAAGKGARRVYRAVTGAERVAGAVSTVRGSKNEAASKAIRESGVDLTDKAAVRQWAKENKDTLTRAAFQGLRDAATDRIGAPPRQGPQCRRRAQTGRRWRGSGT